MCDFLFLFFPGSAAEISQFYPAGATADVFVYEVYFVGGYVDDGLVGVFEGEEFFFSAVFGEGFHAAEAADAVIDVDDEVVCFQVSEGFDGLNSFDASYTSFLLMLGEEFVVA